MGYIFGGDTGIASAAELKRRRAIAHAEMVVMSHDKQVFVRQISARNLSDDVGGCGLPVLLGCYVVRQAGSLLRPPGAHALRRDSVTPLGTAPRHRGG